MNVMSNHIFEMNSVKKALNNSGEGHSPGRCPTENPLGYHYTIFIAGL